jgi:hypothetical protein
MNGALKRLSPQWGSNPQPFSHESSALTTRPRLLAKKKQLLFVPDANCWTDTVETQSIPLRNK